MRISDWSSDVCSSDLEGRLVGQQEVSHGARCSCRRGWRLARAALRADMRCLNSTSAARGHPNPLHPERKSAVSGKSVSVRVDLGGRRIIYKKKRLIQLLNKHTQA